MGTWIKPSQATTWGSITGTLANQTDLQTAMDDKLPLSGGTMTGAITTSAVDALVQSTNDSYIRISGAQNYWSGATLELTGKDGDDAEANGRFLLQATNGSVYKALIGKPDGTLTWDSSPVITQALDKTITASVSNVLTQSASNSYTRICGGTGTSNGAFIELAGNSNETTAYQGRFYITARKSSTVTYSLAGYPDGTLTWGNSPVITQSSGDSRYLKLSGGTLTNSLTVSSGSITITGGYLYLTSGKALVGTSSGGLTWGSNDISGNVNTATVTKKSGVSGTILLYSIGKMRILMFNGVTTTLTGVPTIASVASGHYPKGVTYSSIRGDDADASARLIYITTSGTIIMLYPDSSVSYFGQLVYFVS